MCELFGISSAVPVNPAEWLKDFYSHSIYHPHGWGIMYEQNYQRQIFKEPVRACDSTQLRKLLKTLPDQKTLLAHIRFATVGEVRAENCHPYSGTDHSGRVWTLILNGTIWSRKINYQYFKKQSGDTDSERLFLALLDAVNDSVSRGKLSDQDRCETVSKFVAAIAPRNKLNLMIYDGDILYVHKNLKNTLSYRRLDHGFAFSTQPLSEGEWIPFPMAQVIAFRNGSEIWRGERHKGIYVPTLDYIAVMDAMNI